MSELPKTKLFDSCNAAVKGLNERLGEIAEIHPKFEIRSTCFHREDPATGGKWFIRVRGHVKGKLGPIETIL